MKLKTLNDIEEEEAKEYEKLGEDYSGWATLERIKAEAIKWVKEDNEFGWTAFRKFHNITEEDLK